MSLRNGHVIPAQIPPAAPEKPTPLSAGLTINMLCPLCWQTFDGPAKACPKCGKSLPQKREGA